MYSTKEIYVMFSLKCMSSGPKNNTGIIAPFNFVWAARQWPRGDRRRMRKWHGCWKLWGASDPILETCRRMSSDTSIQMNNMWF